MTPPYRVLPVADADLDDQAADLARTASLETALRFYDAARTTFERIARDPGLGERRESPNPRLANLFHATPPRKSPNPEIPRRLAMIV